MVVAPIDWIQFLQWLRRRPWIVIASVLVALAGGTVALRYLPKSYRASTQIMLEPARVSAEFVTPTVKEDLRDRLATIQQQITNRETLAQIVRDTGLYPELVARGGVDAATHRTAANLRIQVQGRQRQVFEVAFYDANPEVAAAVANRVAEVFIERNLQQRERLVTGTTSFLELELAATRERLEEQEQLIARFKADHLGELPEQRDTLVGTIESNQDRLELVALAADRASTRRLTLVRELESPAAQSSPLAATAAEKLPKESPYARLNTLQAEMAQLRARYTDKHPDVIRLEREIAALTAALGENPEPTENDAPASPPESSYKRSLRQEIEEVDREIAQLGAERRKIVAEIEADQIRLRNIPRVETELTSLTRDYDTIESNYRSLLDKRLEAGIAENLEKKQQGEQFRILARAIPPGMPASPNSRFVMMVSFMLGLGVGVGLTFLRFWADQTLPNRAALESHLGSVEVLGSIPLLDELSSTAGADRPSTASGLGERRLLTDARWKKASTAGGSSRRRGVAATPWASALEATRGQGALGALASDPIDVSESAEDDADA